MSDLSFDQQLLLIMIPTIAGTLTTKWVSNSWQDRKEQYIIKKEILSGFDNSIVKFYDDVYSLYLKLDDSYYLINDKSYVDETGHHVNYTFMFPEDQKEQPLEKFAEEYEKLMGGYFTIVNVLWKFQSTLELYFNDKILSDKFLQATVMMEDQILSIKQLVNSKSGEDYMKYHSKFLVKNVEFIKVLAEMREQLVNKKIIKPKV